MSQCDPLRDFRRRTESCVGNEGSLSSLEHSVGRGGVWGQESSQVDSPGGSGEQQSRAVMLGAEAMASATVRPHSRQGWWRAAGGGGEAVREDVPSGLR